MMLDRSPWMLFAVFALGACTPDSPEGPLETAAVGSSGSNSAGTDPTTTVDPPSDSSTGSGSGDSGTTTNDPTATATTTDGDGSSSSGDDCILGTEGCACDAGTCEGELFCAGEICVAPQCDGDVFEPNDDEDSAIFLGEINDNDDNGGVVSGSLHVPGDVDWFSYQGDDDLIYNVDPARDVVASAPVRICKFIECDNGLDQTDFECPAGSDYALSPMARQGCCITGDMDTLQLPDLNCSGVTEDNAMVYIRVDMPAEDCVSYGVSYHY